MLICGVMITSIVAAGGYVLAFRRWRDHSRSAARVLLALAVVFAVGLVVVSFLRDQQWELYGVMKPPEGAGLRAKLALARGMSASVPFVATALAGFAAARKVVWAYIALAVLLLIDGVFILALAVGGAGGMVG
jgi:hypothetical protein